MNNIKYWRGCEARASHTLSVEVQTGAAIEGTSGEISPKLKIELLRAYVRGPAKHPKDSQRHLDSSFYFDTIYSSQDEESALL